MAHFAEIDSNNVVIRVIVVSDNDCDGGDFPLSEAPGAAFCSKLLGGTWKQTSYNNNFRKQYAGAGYKYNPSLDMFITPKPFPSWALDAYGDWKAPEPHPDDDKFYTWDEETQSWVEVTQDAP